MWFLCHFPCRLKLQLISLMPNYTVIAAVAFFRMAHIFCTLATSKNTVFPTHFLYLAHVPTFPVFSLRIYKNPKTKYTI